MFPNITLVFSKDSSLPLTPRAYLFQKSHSSAHVGAATWCLGFLDGGPDTATIGAITIRDVAVTFDNDQRELRFRPVHSCLEFSAALLAETSAKDQNATAPNSSHHSPAVVLVSPLFPFILTLLSGAVDGVLLALWTVLVAIAAH